MTTRTLPVYATNRPVEIEACVTCSLLWFDRSESVGLTPEAVIELFKFIGTAAPPPERPTLASSFACPRCAKTLLLTHDLQRTTRFTYWRCVTDGGHLITFQQFLREKNFVRTPSLAELAKLKATVRQLACSQCGAPIDLATDSACTHCGAPISLIDPDGVAKAMNSFAAESAARAPADPEAMRAVLANANADAILALEAMRERDDSRRDLGTDLVAVGAAALGAWLTSRLIDG